MTHAAAPTRAFQRHRVFPKCTACALTPGKHEAGDRHWCDTCARNALLARQMVSGEAECLCDVTGCENDAPCELCTRCGGAEKAAGERCGCHYGVVPTHTNDDEDAIYCHAHRKPCGKCGGKGEYQHDCGYHGYVWEQCEPCGGNGRREA